MVRIMEFFAPAPTNTQTACPVCNVAVVLEITPDASGLKNTPLLGSVACDECVRITRKISALEDALGRAAWILKKKSKERESLNTKFNPAYRDKELEAKFATVAEEIRQLKEKISKGTDSLENFRKEIELRKAKNG